MKPILKKINLKSYKPSFKFKAKDSNQTFNNLIDKNIITSSTNIKGRNLSVSEAFCEISGYTKDELLGKNHNILKHQI